MLESQESCSAEVRHCQNLQGSCTRNRAHLEAQRRVPEAHQHGDGAGAGQQVGQQEQLDDVVALHSQGATCECGNSSETQHIHAASNIVGSAVVWNSAKLLLLYTTRDQDSGKGHSAGAP